MDVGVGLPATHPEAVGPELLDWARAAEESGFTTLAVLDRLVYGNGEPLVTLAAAAAVTHRVRLATTILIAAYRANPVLLAKQLATVDRLSGGRLVVGLAAGGRPDDFEVSGVPYAGRGARLDEAVECLQRQWDGRSGVGPPPAGRPPLLFGGHSGPAMRRAARDGDGWIAGASAGPAYGRMLERFRMEWAAAGRDSEPRLFGLAYYALGPGAEEAAERYVRRYYASSGPYADKVLASVLTDVSAIRDRIAQYAEEGCDEMLFFPCSADRAQLDLLADAVR